jgi:hypothetical protein
MKTPSHIICAKIKNTRFTPIHVTLLFGFGNSYLLYLTKPYYLAGFHLKSIIDGADGELAQRTPLYTDTSIVFCYIILNFLF